MDKKYFNQTDDAYPDLGNFIHWHIRQQNKKKADVAEELGIHRNTLNGYFKQPSVQGAILWRISRAMGYNLLMDLGQRLNIPFETNIEKQLREELAEKNEKIRELEIRLEVYKEIRK